MSWLNSRWRQRSLKAVVIFLVGIGPLVAAHAPAVADETFPGEGKRVVYSRSERKVWLVREDGSLFASWKVTGHPSKPAVGTYRVYSKSMFTRTVDGRYSFGHMVRFARTAAGIGIGFHDLPYATATHTPIMPASKIGSAGYRSGGCVRQSEENARRMWSWATVGTQVVVLK